MATISDLMIGWVVMGICIWYFLYRQNTVWSRTLAALGFLMLGMMGYYSIGDNAVGWGMMGIMTIVFGTEMIKIVKAVV